MGQEYQKGASQLAAVYESKVQLLAQESEQASKRKANELIFEEELRLARIVAAIIKYPNELLDLPVDYAVTLLDGVIRFCRAQGINPKIRLIDFLGTAFPDFNSQTPVDALYMLNQARALLSSGMR